RRALPAPDGGAFARHAYEAPQGEIETTLAQLWSELLGVDRVGRHDHFFELGGHSLLAVQLQNQALDFGIKFDINDLFQSPLLLDLARRIAVSSSRLTIACALPIRRAGKQQPLFFVPTGMGDHSYAFELARDINADFPIYALPWESAHILQAETIEILANRMVAMIQTIQPRGPYHLAGYSSGGLLAYAVAQQLLRIDEAVAFIGLVDVGLPSGEFAPVTTAKQMLLDVIKHEQITSIEGTQQVTELRHLAADTSLETMIEAAHRLGLLSIDLDMRTEAMAWEQRGHFARLRQAYEIPSLSAVVHQFYSTGPLPLTNDQAHHIQESEVGVAISDDLVMTEFHRSIAGWERVLPASAIISIPIPGDHVSMMTDPANRAILGTRISEILQAQVTCPPVSGPN
ncbi:thioesterase domain-containing protein, partial [Burkholderia sp. Se-20378]|uniref:thioesterase domain-containing protein n=1 Tax=Burkholderia sp. Se-20378 TaxID=2703899 RepID=UPI001EBF48E0